MARTASIPAAEGKVKPVAVKLGLNNGSATEIRTDALKEGDAVVNAVQVLAVGMMNVNKH